MVDLKWPKRAVMSYGPQGDQCYLIVVVANKIIELYHICEGFYKLCGSTDETATPAWRGANVGQPVMNPEGPTFTFNPQGPEM